MVPLAASDGEQPGLGELRWDVESAGQSVVS